MRWMERFQYTGDRFGIGAYLHIPRHTMVFRWQPLFGHIAILYLRRGLWDIANDDVSKMAEGGGIDDVGW